MTEPSGSEPEKPEPASDDAPGEDEGSGARMSLLEHLSELRYRLRNAFIAFLIALILAFAFQKNLFEVLTRPVRAGMKAAGKDLVIYQLSITEAFFVYFQIAIVAGILFSAPFIFWELWKFVAPGLYRKEKRLALVVVGATALCFSGGAIFGYYMLMKPAVYFLVSYAESMPVPAGVNALKVGLMLSMEKVADFETMMLLGCGLAFELPVVVSILGALGIVSARSLWRFNKYSLILSALLGGILTPGPDVVSQLLLAGPIFGLYNVSILVVFLVERARKKKLDALDDEYKVKDD